MYMRSGLVNCCVLRCCFCVCASHGWLMRSSCISHTHMLRGEKTDLSYRLSEYVYVQGDLLVVLRLSIYFPVFFIGVLSPLVLYLRRLFTMAHLYRSVRPPRLHRRRRRALPLSPAASACFSSCIGVTMLLRMILWSPPKIF